MFKAVLPRTAKNLETSLIFLNNNIDFSDENSKDRSDLLRNQDFFLFCANFNPLVQSISCWFTPENKTYIHHVQNFQVN